MSLFERAQRAYFRRFGTEASQPARDEDALIEIDGKQFFELHNCSGRLALYRVFDSGRLAWVE